MQLRRSLGLICAESILLLYATGASALSLKPFEEVETQLVSSNPFTYESVNNTLVLIPVTSTPLVCGNTSAPFPFTSPISPRYSRSGDFQKPFVFGAAPATPTTSAAAYGSTLKYSGATTELLGDPALVCYGLDANGVHGPTPGVLRDQFEGVNYSPTFKKSFNSSVVLTVVHLPTSPTDYYSYTIDVTIPAKPDAGCGSTVDCNFALLEGFDSSVFSTNAGGWCLANAGATSCPGNPRLGGININYSNYVDMQANLAAGAATATYHFVVIRYFASGVSALPQTDKAVAMAALFSPFDLDENFIGDNVAAGFTNSAPVVVKSDAAWTTFSNNLSALSENTNTRALSFNISDGDTAGAMTANVTLNLAGLSVPVTPACSAGSGSGAANYQCSIDLNFGTATWWDASVEAAYKGLANAFATDPGNAGATATIVAFDANNKASAAVTVPIHVQSTVNNPPVVVFGAGLPSVADSDQGGSAFPTYSCSVAAGNCGEHFNVVTLGHAVSAQPGPAAAFDELATQTVDANDVTCGQSGENDALFVFSPVVELSSASATDFDIAFQLKSPLVTGSSLCTVVITDKAASYPSGQSAATTSRQFRVVVNP